MSQEPNLAPKVPHAKAARLMRLATYASVSAAGFLVAAKLGAWLLTDSVSLLSTLIDSLLDVAASAVNLVAVRHALTPADQDHRFGHGKAEPLAALAQATFITGSAIFLVIEVGRRLFDPRPVMHGNIGIGVMVLAIVVTVGLVLFQRYVVRQTGSLAIKADSLHYVGDILVNGAVIAALIMVSQFGWDYADPILGLAIAGYILKIAWDIVKGSLKMLMDEELPEKDRRRIWDIVLQHPDVENLHDLRTRSSGRKTFIQFHIEMNGQMSLYQAHAIADEVEARLLAVYPDAEIIIHQDPHGLKEDTAIFE